VLDDDVQRLKTN